MVEADWHNAEQKTLGVLLDGRSIDEMNDKGKRIVGNTILILFSSHHEAATFTLPSFEWEGAKWHLLLDTVDRQLDPTWTPGDLFNMPSHSLAIFRLSKPPKSAEPESRLPLIIEKAITPKKRIRSRVPR
jgi:glycogen operon protein